ncbi:hypothetical protein AAE02nite_09180 [Adhaeribacter aerolatus]|uniref:Adhesin n=1 Tax=Adhaeribacter aerolatus TaxID=670289 RepID=A0A512AU72_9BACT|nr:DUF5627 domain-containing protein [Adhaeribacter aerolatus]GEO03254.1 hypothetical protein AAE02nite_09180 [Adhaeribacter aerolatus]
MKKISFTFLIILAMLTSCENQEVVFPDFDYQSTYFAYQYPVRTITLGEDIFDTTLDNEHKFQIMATTGGVYENKKDVTIGVAVNNELNQNLRFSPNGSEVKTMPDGYYKLTSDKIIIPKGKLIGGVEVQLTDAFFADPLAIKNTYVIPLKITNVENADSVLTGKDFTLYAVKYVNPWHGFYLRRGKDVIEGKNGNTSLSQTIVRHQPYVEKDELIKLSTQSLSKVEVPVVYKDKEGKNINTTLILTFDEQGNCSVTTNATNYTVSGNGKFVKRGEKKSWGNTDRDAIYLNYKIDLEQMQVTSTDTLVMRNRGVAMETFVPVGK